MPSHHYLTENYEITRVHPDVDSTRNLEQVARDYSDDGCTWHIDGSVVVFTRPLGTSLSGRDPQ